MDRPTNSEFSPSIDTGIGHITKLSTDENYSFSVRNVNKEHLNFIAGIKPDNRMHTKRQKSKNVDEFDRQRYLLTSSTDDDDDIVLENEINKNLIESYEKEMYFISSADDLNLPKINISPDSLLKDHEDLADVKVIDSSGNSSKLDENQISILTQNTSDERCEFRLGNVIDNEQIVSSPTYIRDRYYQILREQVFPFLQRPFNDTNVNQSAKEIQSYSNDVLY